MAAGEKDDVYQSRNAAETFKDLDDIYPEISWQGADR